MEQHGTAGGLERLGPEVRSSLNVVLGAAELLAEMPLCPEQLGYLASLREAGERLEGILTDFLDLSAIESGRYSLASVPFRLQDVMEETRALIERRAAAAGGEVSCTVAADVPPELIGDPGQLRRVLLRLVDHVLEPDARGDVRMAVERGPEAQDALHFTIAIPGGAAPPAAVPEFRLDVCRRLANMMGGQIRIETGAAGETLVRVSARFRAPACRTAAISRPPIGRARVLVADAGPVNRTIVQEILKLEGAAVEHASSPAGAWAELRRARAKGLPYGILVLDAALPGDGFRSVVEQLRSEPWPDGPGVVVIASEDVPEDRQWLAAVGIEAYLVRPFRRPELVEAIVRCLGNRELNRVAPEPQPAPAPRCVTASGLWAENMPEALRALVPQFLEQQQTGVAVLRRADWGRDDAGIRRYAQVLAGTAEKFELQTLVTLGRRLERAAANGNWPAIRRHLDAIDRSLSAARLTLVQCA